MRETPSAPGGNYFVTMTHQSAASLASRDHRPMAIQPHCFHPCRTRGLAVEMEALAPALLAPLGGYPTPEVDADAGWLAQNYGGGPAGPSDFARLLPSSSASELPSLLLRLHKLDAAAGKSIAGASVPSPANASVAVFSVADA